MAGPKLHAGALRDRVRIDRRQRLNAEGQAEAWNESEQTWESAPDDWDPGDGDGAGNFEHGWAVFIISRAAKIEARRGGEQVIADRLTGIAAFDIWLRYDAETKNIRAGDRVVDARDESRIFNIRFAEPLDQKRRWLLLQCEAGTADG